MRFLANENFPRDAVEALRKRGHDVAWVRTDAPGSTDDEVLERGQGEQRVHLTFDKDFGRLAFHSNRAAEAGVILFRMRAKSADELISLLVDRLDSRKDWAGHFSVVEAQRLRMVKLENPSR